MQDNIALITIAKKNGGTLTAKIDAEDLEKVQSMGTWFAEWHKDFNSYLVQNNKVTIVDGKRKSAKQNLHTFLLAGEAKETIRHINEDTLDNKKANLEVFNPNARNTYEIIDEDTVSILLKNKYGKNEAKTLISKSDLDDIITDEYSWIYNKNSGRPCIIANTPKGKIRLDRLLMNSPDNMRVHHINLNPLDNRRSNLENKKKMV